MKTILVLSLHPDFAEAIRAGLNTDLYRVVHRLSVDDAEPLLVHGLAAVCIVDVDLMGVEGIWVIERLRRYDTKSPVIAYTAGIQSEWEEEAFLRGATHVLTKPVRPRLLNSLLAGFAAAPVQSVRTSPSNSFDRPPEFSQPRAVNTTPTLDVLRDFSPILTYSLNAEAMLNQFLSFLRENLGVNRAAIFLSQIGGPDKTPAPGTNRSLHAAAAIGLSTMLLENIELSLDAGIGGQIYRLGRILRRDSAETRADAGAQKEFELLGGQVAVPIADRNGMVGVAVFDARITGEPLANAELELIFHLLEQVGLALRNIWLHEQIASNNEMMSDVLRELSSACIVVGQDLKVLHANKSARRHFNRKNQHTGELEFSDLPHMLGAKIYQVLKTGAAMGAVSLRVRNPSGTIYNISVVPLQRGNAACRFPRCSPPRTSRRLNSFRNWKSRPKICAWSKTWLIAWHTKSATRWCRCPRISSCSGKNSRMRNFVNRSTRRLPPASSGSPAWSTRCVSSHAKAIWNRNPFRLEP